MADNETPEPVEASKATRVAAHAMLDRWILDCEERAVTWVESGRGGQVGELRFLAQAQDDSLGIEAVRVFTDDLTEE